MSQSKISDFYNVRKKQNTGNKNFKIRKPKKVRQTDIFDLLREKKVIVTNEGTKDQNKIATNKSNIPNLEGSLRLTSEKDVGVERVSKYQTDRFCVKNHDTSTKVKDILNENDFESKSKQLEENISEDTKQHISLENKKKNYQNNSKLAALERISDKANKNITSAYQREQLLTPNLRQTTSVAKKLLSSSTKEPLSNDKKNLKQVQTPKKQPMTPVVTPTKRLRISPMKLLEEMQSPSKKLHLEDFSKFHSSPSKLSVFSPIKKNSEKACTKFKYLTKTDSTTLPLPHSYTSLYHLFSNLDLVISIFNTRQQICTFDKVKIAVDKMDKAYSLNANSLGQVITVDENLYELKQEKGLPTFGEGRSSEYQLTIEPILDDDKETKTLSCQKLAQRKESFKRKLINIVMTHHKIFLKKLSRPIQLDESLIERWHPKFKLDSVPPIKPTLLPQPPLTSTPIVTAAKALEIIKGNPDPKIKEVLQKIIKAKEEKTKISDTTTVTNKAVPNATQGISKILLEKVRRKESIREAEAMMAISSRTSILQRLPSLAKILRQFFMNQKRPAVTRDAVIKCFCDSYNSKLSTLEATTHLNLLMELLPWWLEEIRISKGTYVRMMPSIQMVDVYEALKTAS